MIIFTKKPTTESAEFSPSSHICFLKLDVQPIYD